MAKKIAKKAKRMHKKELNMKDHQSRLQAMPADFTGRWGWLVALTALVAVMVLLKLRF